eukprot:s907_g9.t1
MWPYLAGSAQSVSASARSSQKLTVTLVGLNAVQQHARHAESKIAFCAPNLDHQCTTTAAMGCEESKPDQTQEWTEAQPAEGGRCIEVLIPDGAVEGAQLDFKSPDGVWMKATVPEGYNPGDKISVLVPEEAPKKETHSHAFQYMDKKFTGYITDHSLFAEVAKDLLGLEGTTEEIWSTLDQDSPAVLFALLGVCEANHVELELGAPGLGADGAVAFPPLWTLSLEQGPKDDPSFVGQYDVEDDDHFKELIELVRKTYKKVWTRDRKKTGSDKVPSSFELVKAKRCENLKDWKRYYFRRHQIAHACSHKTGFMKRPVLTSEAKKLSKRQGLRGHCNEWFLFHGTSPEAAKSILSGSGDFTISLAGSATGTLYGRGTYFAESITKADEYAKEDDDGLCCVLVCRVAAGHVLYNDEVTPDADKLQQSCISGETHSILGDREKCRGTFKDRDF